MLKRFLTCFCLLLLLGFSYGCRSYRSEKPPVHLNPNLDEQPKFKVQSLSLPAPEGVRPWGDMRSIANRERRLKYNPIEGLSLYQGKSSSGDYLEKIPMKVDEFFIKKGQESYGIYCAVCHDSSGRGRGVVVRRGFVPPPSFHDDRVRAMPDGELFNVISNGVRNMPAYGKQIQESDRWAIVSYIRALQRMEQTSKDELPAYLLKKMK